MKQDRLPAEPGPLIQFFEEGLERLGAICERTWHDRLAVLAEGEPARLWRDDDALHETELQFPAPEDSGPRDAAAQVFPGCPLTFRLVETLWRVGSPQGRLMLAPAEEAAQPPATERAEKLWLQQTGRAAQLDGQSWERVWHFSVVAAVRCEVQAIDQHWSFHRIAFALASGERDDPLAAELNFQRTSPAPAETVPWPGLQAEHWETPLREALLHDLGPELSNIQRRQERYLTRELHRLEDYFTQYERELTERLGRQHKPEAKARAADRLQAAAAEHARRRADQLQRHQIRLIPHLDTLLLVAETAWQTRGHYRHGQTIGHALFVPRARRWFLG